MHIRTGPVNRLVLNLDGSFTAVFCVPRHSFIAGRYVLAWALWFDCLAPALVGGCFCKFLIWVRRAIRRMIGIHGAGRNDQSECKTKCSKSMEARTGGSKTFTY